MSALIIGQIAEFIHAIIYLCGQIFICIVFLDIFSRKTGITKNGVIILMMHAITHNEKEIEESKLE
jgi:hypothetical protein